MALIMFLGMFGFGEMVSSISFRGDERIGVCGCECLFKTGNVTLKDSSFPFSFFKKFVDMCSV